MNDLFYWMVTKGAPIIASMILGVFGLIILKLYRNLAPKLTESKHKDQLEEVKCRNYTLNLDLQRITSQLADKDEEVEELRNSIRSLTEDIEEEQEKYRQLKRSEEAYKDNIDVLMSSLEDAILASQPAGGLGSIELQNTARNTAEKLLRETERNTLAKLNAHNYPASKKRLEAIFTFLERQGIPFSDERRNEVFENLKAAFKHEVQKEFEREEQARIRQQIREEAKIFAENERKVNQLKAQEEIIAEAIRKELEKNHNEYSYEIKALQAQLAEAQANQRAISQAQLTKSGHVYVISNIGAFGEDIYKVGMSRRLEPEDRIRELSGASVPFPFDVHLMISCDDAPALERALHYELRKERVNKVNLRKEFFKVNLERIIQIVEANHGKVEFRLDADAEQYRNTQIITDEEEAFIDSVLDPFLPNEVE